MAAAAAATIEIRLPRAAVISGRVIDEFGEPAVDARVAAEPVSLPPDWKGSFPAVEVNDRGEYRLTGLPAGSFACRCTACARSS